MIEPSGNLVPLSSRPPIQTPAWQRCVGAIASPFVRRSIQSNYPNRLNRLSEVLGLARQCNTRDELESLLGPPKYVLDGNSYSSIPTDTNRQQQPELVEVYELDNCGIELMFRDGRMIEMIGIPMPTNWEIATGALA